MERYDRPNEPLTGHSGTQPHEKRPLHLPLLLRLPPNSDLMADFVTSSSTRHHHTTATIAKEEEYLTPLDWKSIRH